MTQPAKTLFESRISGLECIHRGKVRDLYAIDDDYMLIVTTDRLSAFDVVLPDPMPLKGYVLTQISNFWFEKTQHIVPNHLTTLRLSDVIVNEEERAPLIGRAIVVRRLKALPIEAVVRGYLIGSGWKDYQATGSVCNIRLPVDLQLAQQLQDPLYTPATKAAVGDHDENISYEQTIELVGKDVAETVRQVALSLYEFAAGYARTKGIIIADTKFEFGLDEHSNVVLIDEALTPDSSRFWDTESYQLGISPPSFDKQIVRDYLETLDWDKTPPGPNLPTEVLERTSAKYLEAHRILAEND